MDNALSRFWLKAAAGAVIDKHSPWGQEVLIHFICLPVKGYAYMKGVTLREYFLRRYPELVHGISALNLCREGPECKNLQPCACRGLCQHIAGTDDPFSALSPDSDDHVLPHFVTPFPLTSLFKTPVLILLLAVFIHFVGENRAIYDSSAGDAPPAVKVVMA